MDTCGRVCILYQIRIQYGCGPHMWQIRIREVSVKYRNMWYVGRHVSGQLLDMAQPSPIITGDLLTLHFPACLPAPPARHPHTLPPTQATTSSRRRDTGEETPSWLPRTQASATSNPAGHDDFAPRPCQQAVMTSPCHDHLWVYSHLDFPFSI
jgi:hypothetical protein